MTRTLVGVLVVVALLVGACGDGGSDDTTVLQPSTTTEVGGTGAAGCSAAGMPAEVSALPGLPQVVGQMRASIVTAATNCDYPHLIGLAREGPGEFIFSGDETLFFVGPADEAITFLRGFEDDGDDLLAGVVELLDGPFGYIEDPEPWGLLDDPAIGPLYVWPATSADPESLVGRRTGITATGDWVFYHFSDN